MADAGNELQRRHTAALAELTAHFKERKESRPLLAIELQRFKPGGWSAGWATTVSPDGVSIPLYFLVNAQLPFSLPKIFLDDASLCGTVPHVNDDGSLCLLPNSATWSHTRTKLLAEELLGSAADLLSKNGFRKEDFADEFQNYWGCQKLTDRPMWSLIRPEGPSRSIAFFDGANYTLMAEEISDCQDWLKNKANLPEVSKTPWGQTSLDSSAADKIKARTSMLLWLDAPLYPEEYPKNARAIAELAKRAGPGALERLQDEVQAAEGNLPIMLGFNTANGPALAGVWLSAPKNKNHGFRRAVPKEIAAARWLTDAAVLPTEVRRADPRWISGRAAGDISTNLQGKKVVIIGCGSLGADIAFLLAKAGVGNFVLIDGDIFGWQNVGRHLLGGGDVGKRKDAALRRFLLAQMPHLWIRMPEDPKRWEAAYARDPKIISSADLIISTSGDWAAESALNIVNKRILTFPPVLFGWTEPYGQAGHGLAVLDSGGCLGCGMNEFGKFLPTATAWPNGGTLKRAPACGEFFQPYGILETTPIKSMLGVLAIDVLLKRVHQSELRTWLGASTSLSASGGKWDPTWVNRHGDPGEGNTIRQTTWETNPSCELCK